VRLPFSDIGPTIARRSQEGMAMSEAVGAIARVVEVPGVVHAG
jgi:hypothetical protein